MSEDTTTISLSEGVQTVPEALAILADCINVLAGEEKARSASTLTMDEVRNRAIYELNRENVSDAIDDQDDTLPYLAATGCKLDKVIAISDNVEGAINLILADKDNWTVVTDEEAKK